MFQTTNQVGTSRLKLLFNPHLYQICFNGATKASLAFRMDTTTVGNLSIRYHWPTKSLVHHVLIFSRGNSMKFAMFHHFPIFSLWKSMKSAIFLVEFPHLEADPPRVFFVLNSFTVACFAAPARACRVWMRPVISRGFSATAGHGWWVDTKNDGVIVTAIVSYNMLFS